MICSIPNVLSIKTIPKLTLCENVYVAIHAVYLDVVDGLLCFVDLGSNARRIHPFSTGIE